MIELLKRHEIQVLRRAGHSQPEVAKLTGVSERTVQRVEAEPAVSHVDTAVERMERKIGRPSKAEPFRSFVVELLAKEPDLLSVEILRRARLEGYDGGKTALYDLVHSIRPKLGISRTAFSTLLDRGGAYAATTWRGHAQPHTDRAAPTARTLRRDTCTSFARDLPFGSLIVS